MASRRQTGSISSSPAARAVASAGETTAQGIPPTAAEETGGKTAGATINRASASVASAASTLSGVSGGTGAATAPNACTAKYSTGIASVFAPQIRTRSPCSTPNARRRAAVVRIRTRNSSYVTASGPQRRAILWGGRVAVVRRCASRVSASTLDTKLSLGCQQTPDVADTLHAQDLGHSQPVIQNPLDLHDQTDLAERVHGRNFFEARLGAQRTVVFQLQGIAQDRYHRVFSHMCVQSAFLPRPQPHGS